jgi:hypothetical protein
MRVFLKNPSLTGNRAALQVLLANELGITITMRLNSPMPGRRVAEYHISAFCGLYIPCCGLGCTR